jgi:hypothetical protein
VLLETNHAIINHKKKNDGDGERERESNKRGISFRKEKRYKRKGLAGN